MNMGIIAASRLRGAPFVGFLNEFSGASLGLSLVLLISNYLGFCIRVRRSSDDTELDIGFVNGVLDTASLLDFVGSGNGFVSIIYEQIAGNNFIQLDYELQGQIVSNGSVILKGGKPCIIRSISNNGGYISTYKPNEGATVKGLFYVGDNEDKPRNIMFSAPDGGPNFVMAITDNASTGVDSNVEINLTKVNGITKVFNIRSEARNATNFQFLLYREIEFNYDLNKPLTFGYGGSGFGMYAFQELAIFENTDDATAKQNNINARYNIY